MEFIDTHCHICDKAFAGEEDAYIARALDAGVVTMLQADTDSRERAAMFALVDAHPGVLRPMLGLYPGSVDADWRMELDEMEKWKGRPDIVAIGEIGLDYHYGADFKKEQKEAFRAQLGMAAAMDLPVNIHLREATEDFFEIVESCAHLGLRGNLHAFSGSYETFRRLSRSGDWYVGIGGVVTFRKASIGEEITRFPADRILLETDAPYLTPVPHRGERNESAMISLIAAFLAGKFNVPVERIAEQTTNNAKTLFRI